jgi:tetratricopeptide (TPR) repeat protein
MTNSDATDAPNARLTWLRRGLFCVVCAAVIGMLFIGAEPGLSVLKNSDAKDCYYNLLIQGFRAGQLNLKKDVPPGLARLANPYDPVANRPYIDDVGDMSYYTGKLYLYYGVAPALVLYWPFLAITGHYLQDEWAGLIFCSLGYLAGAVLLYAIWRRYFPRVNMWVAMAGIFIFGLMIPAHESNWLGMRIYEVTENAGFAFGMLALAAIWAALHQPGRRRLWLLLASFAYGLAVASRPSLLLGAAVLLIPVIYAWRKEKSSPGETGRLLAATLGPILLIGVGQMIYNALRFGNPLNFGCRYEVTGIAPTSAFGQFSLHYFWFNFQYYFWEPIHWSRHMPFIQPVHWNPSSPGNFGLELYYGGLLTMYPPVWLALAAPLAWRSASESRLRWFVATASLLFVAGALPICLFNIANLRYELDFLPALMLVAVIGIFAIENDGIGSRVWRSIGRWGWRALAACMLITCLSASLDTYVTANYFAGNTLVSRGLPDEAIERFLQALAIEPQYSGAYEGLGNALVQKGHAADAIAEYEKAIEIRPDLIETRYNLGHCYYETGRIQDCIAQDQIVLKQDPNFVKARNDLASCFLLENRIAEALAQLQKAVQIAPDFADARNNLGFCLLRAGRVPEAIAQFQQAVELDPQSANYRCGLGNALLKAGHVDEANAEYQKAVELAPDAAGTHYVLASGLLQNERLDDAIREYRKAVELKPDSATYHWGLAGALAKKGLTDEAASEYKKAVELQPALAEKLSVQIEQDQLKTTTLKR